MSFINNIKKIPLVIIGVVFLYLLGMLVFNTDRGFDMTDESYYILNSTYPNDIFSVVTHEGYYTKVLYFLSGYNLAYFRLLGIITLLLASFWLAKEVIKYISSRFIINFDIWDKVLFISTICLSSFVYYRSWLLTPSYNWLSLLSVILVVATLLKIVNNFDRINGRIVSVEYFILSFFLSMTFMAKPTTALALTFLVILFLIYERKAIDIKRGVLSVGFTTIMIVLLHILLLDGGVTNYYYTLIESLYRISLMGGGHGIGHSFFAIFDNFEQVMKNRSSLLSIKNLAFLFTLYIVFILLLDKFKNKINVSLIFDIFIYSVITLFAYLVVKHNILTYDIKRISFLASLYLLGGLYIFYFSTLLFIKEKKALLIQILKTIPLSLILILMALAVSFGTNNNIVFHMTIAFIFVASSLMLITFVLDKHQDIISTRFITALAIASFTLFSIKYAYNKPYRLNTDISQQNQHVNILGGIKVDTEHKKYIDSLLNIKEKYIKDGQQITLLDTTGASPGATAILGAKFIEQSWLLGGYKGSNQYVYRILKEVDRNILTSAWILVAPKGRRSLDINLLDNLGLKFPQNYTKVGTLFLKVRNETQELWVPTSK